MKVRRQSKNRNALIEEYQGYARHVVARLCERMGLPLEHFDEFLAAAYLGLVEAAERFDPEAGVDFKNYAYLRIRGAVIDSIRSGSELSGKVYQYAKALRGMQDLREAMQEEEMVRGKKQGAEALAEFLEYAAKGALTYRLSSEDAEEELPYIEDYKKDPEQLLESRQSNSLFRELIAELPEKERMILEEYYFNEKSFSEIMEEYAGMSKGWVSRLHTRGLAMLKKRYHERASRRFS